MAVATYEDVSIALGRPISETAEQEQVEWWLTGVEMIIRIRLGDPALLDQEALLYVETEAVVAKVQRHGAKESSITVAVDDGSVTRRFDNPVSAEDITDAWWELLSPATTADGFTVSPYATRQIPVGAYRTDWLWG